VTGATTAASLSGEAKSIAGLLILAFDKLGTALVVGPKTGGANDPLNQPFAESFNRLPLELRVALARAAAQLPAWPAEDVLSAWQAAGRLVGAPPLLLRLVQEAKRRGLWPQEDAGFPLDGNARNVAGQLRAVIQVGLEVEAATATGLPYGVPRPPTTLPQSIDTPSPTTERPRDPGAGTPAAPTPTGGERQAAPGWVAPSSAPAASSGAGVVVAAVAGVALLGGLGVFLLRRRSKRRRS
jgi:LPXTG-motif cell wall-anchored protein